MPTGVDESLTDAISAAIEGETDEGLMERAQAGDHRGFAELYDRYAEQAFRVARSVCHDDSRAEDAVQEGFLAAWRSRARFRPEAGSFRSWAMRIVHNRAIDSYRSATRPQEQVTELHDEMIDGRSPSPADQAITREGDDALRASLKRLPDAQTEVIVLAFYGGLSHSEIATRLELPAGTVKGRMRLGLEKLRGQMSVVS